MSDLGTRLPNEGIQCLVPIRITHHFPMLWVFGEERLRRLACLAVAELQGLMRVCASSVHPT